MRKLLVAALAVVLGTAVLLCGCSGAGSSKGEESWPERGISEVLPVPDFGSLDSVFDTGDQFSADLSGVSRDDFEGYLQACKSAGFTVDAQEAGDSYEAYSSEGCFLRLSYLDSSGGSLDISLRAPIEMSTIAWPANAPGSLAPVPPSLTGKVSLDNAETYSVYIGQMDAQEYAAYVDACIAAGFNVDHSRSDDAFSADDAAGNSIRVDYEGFETVYVSVTASDEPSASEAAPADSAPQPQQSAPQASQEPASSAGVTPEFKQMMDEYEAFVDEYVAFMQSYDPSSASADSLVRYSSLMAQYAETMAAIEAVDEETLSEADAVYYAEVTARIASKLSAVV